MEQNVTSNAANKATGELQIRFSVRWKILNVFLKLAVEQRLMGERPGRRWRATTGTPLPGEGFFVRIR